MSMECLQLTEWGSQPELASVPVPDIGADEVLLEIEAASVGLTVHNVINGQLGDEPDWLPRIPGHEFVGRVAETGEQVDGLAEGDLVGSYFYLTCGHCTPCQSGNDSLCENNAGFLGLHRDGGYAEYAAIPAGNAIELPADIDPVAATVATDAAATPYHVANRRADIEPGDDVMVLGAGGGVGIHMVQIAQYFGGTITAVDLSEEKLENCSDLGAEATVNTKSETLSDHVQRTGTQYDAIVDFTGVTELLEEATGILAPGGVLVNLTAFAGNTFPVSPREQVLAETGVIGSRYCAKTELARVGELIADGELEAVVSEVVDLEGVPDLLERIAAKEVVGRGAVRL